MTNQPGVRQTKGKEAEEVNTEAEELKCLIYGVEEAAGTISRFGRNYSQQLMKLAAKKH